jgi:signal transduction histidine kinase
MITLLEDDFDKKRFINPKKLTLNIIEKYFFEKMKEKKIRIYVHENLDVDVNFNEFIFNNIMIRLLDNAVKFNVYNGYINVYMYKETKKNYWIAVRDTGIGIKPGEEKDIFESFYQRESSMTRSYDGLGMGLYVVKLMISLYKGKIFAKTYGENGSEFIFSIKKELK